MISKSDSTIDCYGLIQGFAKIESDNRFVEAKHITKNEGPFYCPECLSTVVVRKCIEKIDHFAHIARLSPTYKSGDRALHDECRDEICMSLKDIFPEGKWKTERLIPEDKGKGTAKLIPDISGRINNVPVVIEEQASTLSISQILKRTIQYKLWGCAILWVIPLRESLGEEPFRPRLFEKYLHSMYFGRTYYWIKGNGTFVYPVHFEKAERWIEESHWFEEDGTERTEGGYSKAFKTIKTPMYGQTLDIANNFSYCMRDEFTPENEKKAVPECIIYKDKLNHWWNKE